MSEDIYKDFERGGRFQFGKNWKAFLSVLDEEKILNAESCMKQFLKVDSLEGMTFLDVGCGSGLHSLVARRMGARVYSFDYDPESVACALVLKDRYFPDDEAWEIHSGSALDTDYLASLGRFDIVYSWGVLHHTGAMYEAFDNVYPLVAEGGTLFLAIYNYQPYWSKFYTLLKKSYVKSPPVLSFLIAAAYVLSQVMVGLVRDLLGFRSPLIRYREKVKERGMSKFYDWIDWVGGYPFEVAKPEEVFAFFHEKGFILENLKTVAGGLACNEFVFSKSVENSSDG